MAERATFAFVEDGIDRFQDAVRSVEQEIGKVQQRVEKQRKVWEKQTQRRVKRFQTDFQKNPTVKRVRAIQADATKTIENGVDTVLASFQIATKSDVKKLDRKLGQLNKKLRELEKSPAA